MSPKALRELTATLREQGVSQYKLVKQGDLEVVELKLFPLPRPPLVGAETKVKAREPIPAEAPMPRELREAGVPPELLAEVQAKANRIYNGGD